MKIDADEFRRDWQSDTISREICKKYGISRGHLHAVANSLGLGRRPVSSWETHPQVPDPTPEEIAERAAEVRAGWSEYDRERRRVGVACGPWQPRALVWSASQKMYVGVG